MADDRNDNVQEIDLSRIVALDDTLYNLVVQSAMDGYTQEEVLFAFARALYRLSTSEEDPPEGEANFVKILGTRGCGCSLHIAFGTCDAPVDMTRDGHEHMVH